jgi:hypothetical protein
MTPTASMAGATTCAECGAPLPDSGACWDRIAELLEIEAHVLDGSESALRAHFFAISTYQLQHPSRLTPPTLDGLRTEVASMVAAPRPIAELRRDVGRRSRGMKISSGTPGDRSRVDPRWPRSWPMTATDVVQRPAEQYVAAVGEWAAGTVEVLATAVPRDEGR